MAASIAGREGIYCRDLLEDLGLGEAGATPLFLDSTATIDLAKDPVAFKKTKHILRHAHWLRDAVSRGVFLPQFVGTAEQLADLLTKAMRPHVHRAMLRLWLWARDDESASVNAP